MRPSLVALARSLASIGIAAILGSVPPARAVDGVIEINAAGAAAGGITPGDTPGFPVQLTQPGSYRLTSSLGTSNKNVTLILVTADYVEIDLNGFMLSACLGGGFCSTGTAGDGIDADAASHVSVRNGTVVGMGHDGVRTGTYARIENLTANGNGALGINAAAGSQVVSSFATQNGACGILVRAGSAVSASNASENADCGIAATKSAIFGNTLIGNAGFGLRMTETCIFSENLFTDNNGHLSQSCGGTSVEYALDKNRYESGIVNHQGICP